MKKSDNRLILLVDPGSFLCLREIRDNKTRFNFDIFLLFMRVKYYYKMLSTHHSLFSFSTIIPLIFVKIIIGHSNSTIN